MSLVELGEPRTAAEMRDRYRAAHHRLYHTRPRPKVIAIHDHTPASQPLSVVVVPRLALVIDPASLEPSGPPQVTIRRILNIVAAAYGVSVIDLTSERRDQKIVGPRHVAFYLARTMTTFSLPRIGHKIGDRDHSTILHGADKITRLMETDEDLRNKVAELRRIIEEGA